MTDTDPYALAFDVKETVLRRLQIGQRQVFSPSMVQGLDFDVFVDMLYGNLVAALYSYVLAEHLADATHTFYFSWPASALQRFKLRHLWLLRWHLLPKVKWANASSTVDVKSWATFPQSTLAAPTLGPAVYMQQVSAQQTRIEVEKERYK